MFIITYRIRDPFLEFFQTLDGEKRKKIAACLISICTEIFPQSMHCEYKFTNITCTITIKDIFVPLEISAAADQLNQALNKSVLGKIFIMTEATSQGVHGDRLYIPSQRIHQPVNSVIAGICNLPTALPPRFLCAITHEIMNNPVYLKTNPLCFYEREAIHEWIKRNGTDPTTRAAVDLTDICEDSSLKEEINSFLQDFMLRHSLEKYYMPTKEIATQTDTIVSLADSFLTVFSSTIADAAKSENSSIDFLSFFEKYQIPEALKIKLAAEFLRQAAANNDVITICQLHTLYGEAILDITDELPSSLKTALHIAAEKGLAEATETLIRLGANQDVQDANGMSGIAYQARWTQNEIKR